MFFFLHKLQNHYNSVRRAKHSVVAHCSEGWYVAVDLPDDYNERY